MQTIVIAGGGAGGLELATRLGDSLGKAGQARIVLVDRWPSHFWKPLLHTVASGKRAAQATSVDYAAQAEGHCFTFQRGDMTGIDRAARTITLAALTGDDGTEIMPQRALAYDKLVLALGSVTNFYAVPGAAEHVFTLDDVPQAQAFHQRFLDGCMRASARHAAGGGDEGLDIVIVGGGATGVELAAELSHSARMLARYKVHALDPVRHVRIRILERGSFLLPHLHPRLSRRAARHLRSLGIKVCTDTAVARVEDGVVIDTEGRAYLSTMTLWAAGVEAPALCRTLDLTVNRLGQVSVGPTLQTVDDPAIYALGDCASLVNPVGGAIAPRAQAAHQQALYLAETLGRPGSPAAFAYRDYGSLVSLGPLAAVGVLSGTVGKRKLQVGGFVARWLYALMYRKHLMALHGFARMAARTAADWISDRISPPVKLH
ncbi:NAD(P)/FAD-dependent oxidoreductase [Massilia sp. PAMC28688]|uniref:NAD(P)/FAD-dependent oxidoreductase n=1 Tax=Massilia sp. PAMC28688 TaxID=2861283 RepID=UPI001C637892|nr:NAD(P)/FAD-dependent oxidoreductase [Massilia sp. PAMC28688]QYF93657.1 NAD(P)/FAD-dependent oxidoreductase [Massilia sp. PAMC28688]